MVFVALYCKTFLGTKAKPVHPQKSPGRAPIKAGYSTKEGQGAISSWDMESSGMADSIPAHRKP